MADPRWKSSSFNLIFFFFLNFGGEVLLLLASRKRANCQRDSYFFLVPQKLQSTSTFHPHAERTSGLEKKNKKEKLKKGSFFLGGI